MKRDIVALGPEGDLKLVVETKSKTGTDQAWAKAWRRNLLSHGSPVRPAYLMLALPDKIYLWNPKTAQDPEAPPQYAVDADKLWEPYLKQTTGDAQGVRGTAFELLIYSWLSDMLHRPDVVEYSKANIPWIAESGLLDDLKDARLALDTAA